MVNLRNTKNVQPTEFCFSDMCGNSLIVCKSGSSISKISKSRVLAREEVGALSYLKLVSTTDSVSTNQKP